MKILRTGLLFFLSILFGAIIFIYVGDAIGWDFILNSFKIFLNFEGLVVIFLSFFIAFLGALRWKGIVKNGQNISLFNLFKIYIAGFSIQYFFPMILFGSEAFRASLLEHREKIGWDRALASVIIERIIEWTINILVILIGVLYFFYEVQKPSQNLALIFGVSIVFFLLILFFVYVYLFKKNSFIKKILFKITKKDYKEGVAIKTEKIVFEYFNIKNINLWKGYFFSILKVLAMFLRVWFIVFFLGNILNFMPSLSILGFSFLSTMVPIPTALGVQELIQSFVFGNLNISLGTSSSFSMILRAGDVIVSLIGCALFFKVGFEFLKNKICKNEK
ncbi:MAG: lysylphosphatidylglycerol synthase transmembrane domain-containing protein [Candidatus Pacebacteria bacterium]|nr:lysylphosphatidylglycerol synthase transmembrane domain-containing protein [Candidatus Paceibacterota bacterium]